MEDISLHILDIVENSLRAKAKNICIEIIEDTKKNTMEIKIKDDGKGMNREEVKKALDPSFTTKEGKRFGMGISLLAQSAQEAGGSCNVISNDGEGTTVTATFEHSNIDRRPLGDMTKTLITLIAANPDLNFYFSHSRDGKDIVLDTRELKNELGEVKINSPEVLNSIKKGLKAYYKILH